MPRKTVRSIESKSHFADQGFPLTVLRMEPQADANMHTHDFTELVLIVGGRGTHVTDEESYPVAAGDVFVITGRLAHGYRNTRDLRLINILYRPGELRLPMADVRKLPGYHALFDLEPRYRRQHRFQSRLRLSPEGISVAETLADRIENEIEAREPGCEFMAKACLMELMVYLSRAYGRMRDPAPEPLLRLGGAISHMERHYREPLSLDDLAARAHMSTSSLLRAFREATGRTPIDYLIRLRVRRACDLLRSGETNVTEAAFRAGFADSNYFSRQFRRVMGTTPSAFRRNARVEP